LNGSIPRIKNRIDYWKRFQFYSLRKNMAVEKLKASPTIGLARLAVSSVFFVAGTLTATWFAQIGQVQTQLGLSKAELGLAGMSLSAGVLLGLTMISGIIARFSSRRVSIGAGLLMALGLLSLSLMPNLLSLAIALFFFGIFTSTMDVAMNAQAVEVERLAGRHIMNAFHAAWSIGNFTGAAIASLALANHLTIFQHFGIVAVAAYLVLLLSMLPLLPIEGERNPENTSAFQFPPRVLWALGAVAFASAMSEGSMLDWSQIYLRDVVGSSLVQSAWGISAVSATMTLGRFLGDGLAERFGGVTLVRGGGILATIGLSLAIFVPTLPATLIGFGLVGAGLSTIIPLAFSAAGKVEGLPSGRGVAGVATFGYSAFLIGPVFIGFVSEATGLQTAFLMVLALLISLIFTAQALSPRKEKTA
jgi:MFS family permease